MEADAQHQKAVLVGRMVWVEKPDRVLVQEDGLSLLKRDVVAPYVLPTFGLIPLESEVTYMYTVRMAWTGVKSFLRGERCAWEAPASYLGACPEWHWLKP